jgi:hypothetical protein
MGIGAAIGGIAGGLLSSKAAGKAAAAQAAAARNQLELEKQIYGETVERFEPFLGAGNDALSALSFELGLAERPTFGDTPEVEEFRDRSILGPRQRQMRYRVGDRTFETQAAADKYAAANPENPMEYQGFQATPGYQFQLDQGLNAIDNSAASRGNLFSGASMKAAQTYGQGLANQEYGNFLNRLTGLAGSGQAAAGNAANAGANYAAGAGNALANIGNAQAAGAIGGANAINSGINNAVGIWNYQNQQSPTNRPQGGIFGNLFG